MNFKEEIDQKVKERTRELLILNEKLEDEIRDIKVIKRSLTTTKDQYRIFVESMGEGLIHVDENEKILYCNDSFCKMLNYRKNEVKDHSIIDFFDKESQNLFKEHFLLCSIGKPRQYEAVLIKKDRQKINVRISPKSLLDDSMTFKGGFAVVTDITEQKRNEKLLNGKIKFEELISSISTKFVNLSLLGVNREITIALKSIAKYLTMDRITLYQKIPGLKHLKQTHVWNAPGAKASFEIIPEIHFPWFLKKYQSGSTHAIINSDDFPESEETDRLNVIKRNFKSAMFFFLAVEGQVLGIISVASVFKPVEIAPEMTDQFQVIGEIFSNIILRIQIETALKESEERLKAIFETNPDPVVVYDVNGFPLYLNHAFTDIFGWEINELSEKCIPFVPEDQKRVTKSKIKKLYDLGTPVQFETSRLSKLGNLIDIHLSAAIIKDIKGISNGIVVNLRDVTEIKKFEVQIRQSQKMEAIGNLASGIAHDFNNILFPIMGNTEMLLEDVPDDSPFRNKLNEIFTSALRGADLVKQILTFSRQEQGVLKLIKMQPVINEAVKMIRSIIPTTINITQNIQRDCGVINADPTQIHQIVMNLATNAYHAMEESGGALEISLRDVEIEKPDALNLEITAGNYARLTVSDSGKGMNKDLTQKIFTPFFTTKEKGKGTGMGLAVVHGIVKNMGGAILVQSDIGKGTKFTLYFPVKKKFGDTEKIQSKKEIIGGVEHILIVDDEDSILSLEKMLLKRLGYKVTSSIKSMEALELFRNSPDKFDMVITDMNMPHMSGTVLSKELLKIRPKIPVLLCTGYYDKKLEAAAVSIGIKGFMMKPVETVTFASTIRDVLDKKKG